MNIRSVAIIAGLAALALPLAVFASQPQVKLADLAPVERFDTDGALSLLLLDPYAETELSISLPAGFATLDVDADPFAAAPVAVAAR